MTREMRKAGFLLLAALLVGALAGCSSLIRPAARDAVGAALDAANDGENRAKLEALLTSAPVERSLRALTHSAVASALAELSTPEREARKEQLAAGFVRDIGPVVGEMLGKDVLPRVRAELAAGVQNALDQALGPASEQRVGAFASAVARRSLGDVGPQIARAISDGVTGGIERSVTGILLVVLGLLLWRLLRDDRRRREAI